MSKQNSIYTTGAYLVPVETSTGVWVWAVEEFDDSTFRDGDCISPNVIGMSLDELLNEQEE